MGSTSPEAATEWSVLFVVVVVVAAAVVVVVVPHQDELSLIRSCLWQLHAKKWLCIISNITYFALLQVLLGNCSFISTVPGTVRLIFIIT